jgi:tripeptide aminopeptidase
VWPLSEGEIRDQLSKMMSIRGILATLDFIRTDHDSTIKEQCELARIEAPANDERERAAVVAEKFRLLGLEDTKVDSAYNAIGVLKGKSNGHRVLLEAHIDTVFPRGSVQGITYKDGILHAPGISDNTRGLAAMLCIIRAIRSSGIELLSDVVFAGTSGEEGLGDLKGMRRLFQPSCEPFDYSISLDGHGEGDFVFDATGSRRYEVDFLTTGGHSWANFGRPSAIHALGRAIDKIAAIKLPIAPKTTVNVGLVGGGTSVNAIAQLASMTVDMRSVSPKELEALEAEFRLAVGEACHEEEERATEKLEVKASFRKVGDRPAGSSPEDTSLIMAAKISSELLGIKFVKSGPSSTNANVPISMGIPALCMGAGGRGGGIHTREEWFDPAQAWKSVQHAALLLVACAGLE